MAAISSEGAHSADPSHVTVLLDSATHRKLAQLIDRIDALIAALPANPPPQIWSGTFVYPPAFTSGSSPPIQGVSMDVSISQDPFAPEGTAPAKAAEAEPAPATEPAVTEGVPVDAAADTPEPEAAEQPQPTPAEETPDVPSA